jgi:hypothetical protein
MSKQMTNKTHIDRWIEERERGGEPIVRGRGRNRPQCRQCGGEMGKKTLSQGNFIGILLALIVFIIGVALTITIPILGWVIGPLLCLVSLGMGGKRRKVWKCGDCGYIFDRA